MGKSTDRTEHACLGCFERDFPRGPVKALMLSLAPSELQNRGFSSAPRINASLPSAMMPGWPHNYGQECYQRAA